MATALIFLCGPDLQGFKNIFYFECIAIAGFTGFYQFSSFSIAVKAGFIVDNL